MENGLKVERLDRKLIHKGAIIDIYTDTVKIPNGNIVKLKTKIPKDLYHLEITKERDNTIVDVHLKTLVIDNQKNLDNSMR